ASPPAPYLESSGSTVEEGEGLAHECRAVGCKSRFCLHCCGHQGRLLKGRLVPALKTFHGGLMMLTLTVDPELFDSPEAAYWYCRDKRSVAELVRALYKAGHLKSKRFFCVVEFHANGWPHFHVLVESSRIPHKVLAQFWGRNRPASAPAWEGD